MRNWQAPGKMRYWIRCIISDRQHKERNVILFNITMCHRQHSVIPITMCCFRETPRSDMSCWTYLVTAVWACWLMAPAPFISTSTDRTREWPPLTCRGPASLSLISSVPTDRWDWSLISLQTGETDLWYYYTQARLIFNILTDRWDWPLGSLQTGETYHWGPNRQVRLTTGQPTNQTTNQPANQSANQPVNQPTSQLVNQPVN